MSDEKNFQDMGVGIGVEILRRALESLTDEDCARICEQFSVPVADKIAATKAAYSCALPNAASVTAGEWLGRYALAPDDVEAIKHAVADSVAGVLTAALMYCSIDWLKVFNFYERLKEQCQKKADDPQDESGSVRELDTIA